MTKEEFMRAGERTDGLPEWEAYTRENGSVMILDDESYLAHHHDEALLKMLAPEYQW